MDTNRASVYYTLLSPNKRMFVAIIAIITSELWSTSRRQAGLHGAEHPGHHGAETRGGEAEANLRKVPWKKHKSWLMILPMFIIRIFMLYCGFILDIIGYLWDYIEEVGLHYIYMEMKSNEIRPNIGY